MAIRKDANTLSTAERNEFVNAVHELKSAGIYDQFVLRHANANMRDIHRSPAFLPWHRRFIWDFEKELQRVSGNSQLSLPYWNWPEGDANASMWNDDLLGGNGDLTTQVVNRGPFRSDQWIIVNSSGSAAGPLMRAFGSQAWARNLPSLQEIEQVLAITPYDVSPWSEISSPSFRNQLEGFNGPNLHNRGHGWVSGSMLPMTSPNDPVFFMHHCMVDKLWYEWQLRFPNQGYLPISGATFGQNLSDPMAATNATPIGARALDVLDSEALDIQYDHLLSGTVPPDNQPAEVVLSIGREVEGEIGSPGEEDLFSFNVPAFGSYTIETTGLSDTVMTLFGPDNPNQQIALNDDGGQGFNSRISQVLAIGSYFVRVRLFSPTVVGRYRLRVESSGVAAIIPDIHIDGPGFDAAISAGRESDLYQFHVDSVGLYKVETTGSTDTLLSLFGPDNQTVEIASDDDSGEFRNASIRAQLMPGDYFARVRHFSDFGTGPYRIRVQSE
jgi:tyrosinase